MKKAFSVGMTMGSVGAAAAFALAACGSKDEGISPEIDKLGRASGPVEPGAPRMPPEAVRAGSAADGEEKAVHEGDVTERIHVPNYTYLKLRTADGRELWTAVPKAQIEVGAHVRVVESIVMEKFTSPSLGRTFDSIVFGVLEGAKDSSNTGDAGAQQLPPGHPPIER